MRAAWKARKRVPIYLVDAGDDVSFLDWCAWMTLAFTFNFRSIRNAKCSRSGVIPVQRPGLEGLGRACEVSYMSRHSSLLDAEM